MLRTRQRPAAVVTATGATVDLIGMVDRSSRDYKRLIKRWEPLRGNLGVIAYHRADPGLHAVAVDAKARLTRAISSLGGSA